MPPKATKKDKSRMSKDGDEYEGETKNDKRHGRGVCKFSDGAVYDGMWKAGKVMEAHAALAEGQPFTPPRAAASA